MQCTCRQDIEEKLMKALKDDTPDSTEHHVRLSGYTMVLGVGIDEYPAMKINSSHVVTAKNGNKREKKTEQTLVCNYCPHCGKKAKKAETETPA